MRIYTAALNCALIVSVTACYEPDIESERMFATESTQWTAKGHNKGEQLFFSGNQVHATQPKSYKNFLGELKLHESYHAWSESSEHIQVTGMAMTPYRRNRSHPFRDITIFHAKDPRLEWYENLSLYWFSGSLLGFTSVMYQKFVE